MNDRRILVREHECHVKCSPRVLKLLFPAEGNALGDIAYQRGLNADGLCRHPS